MLRCTTVNLFFMKNIFITGINRGIGLRLTNEFLGRGHRVIGTHRKAVANSELKKLKVAFPETFNLIHMDLKTMNKSVINESLSQYSVIDVVINNAGILEEGNVSFEKLQIDNLINSINVNTIGPMKITQFLLSRLNASDDPKLFHITSQLGSIADNTSGSYYFYRISKAALNMFNKSFSQDYPNITSIVLHPGWVRTDMGGKNAPVAPEQAAKMLSDLILRLDKASTGQFLNYRGEILSW